MSKKAIKEINRHNDEMSILSSADRFNRARSLTVGTAFNGVTEIVMRGDAKYLWAILQPGEVIELIHQLAANVGCHLHLMPRRDFAAWRDWKYTEEELAHYRGVQHSPGVGHPPHVNDMAPRMQVGSNLPAPEQQPALPAKETKNEQAMATEKTVKRRSTKRTAKTA